MERTRPLLLLFISGFCSFTPGSSDFHLIKTSATYEKAKTFCREMYSDLATIHNATDMNNLITLVGNESPRAWIGLEAADVRMWHWTWPDKGVDFLNWKAGQPLNKNEDACAAMDENGRWFESECAVRRRFVCQGNVFVAETKSWRDAQNHCRGLSSDLVSILSSAQNEAVHNLSGSQEVWIGLFKDTWKWSDGSNSSFRFWKPAQPNDLDRQHCTAAIFKDGGEWNNLRCTSNRNFVCRGAVKSILTTTSQSSAQPTTEQLTTNMPTPSSASSPSNATNVTTTDATTASELTLLNTTVSNTASAELNNATTGISNVTTTQLTPATAVQVTTDGDSASTTLNTTLSNTSSTELNNATTEISNVTTQLTPTTAAQLTTDGASALTILNTTQNTTLQPTDSSPSLTPGNLILIKKNMTWIEAMSYCRKHHIDLVHITTRDGQARVAEKARNATSPYVWLGLRYTCSFNFWFWISSGTNCYLNWAQGQGPEGKYDCGATGAIEATGGQQWVGLPETEKLNFICSSCAG
ncbi:uncharacterized protein AB9X84_022879 [Acanthopagrus schlegelii]